MIWPNLGLACTEIVFGMTLTQVDPRAHVTALQDWVLELVGPTRPEVVTTSNGTQVERHWGNRFTLLTASIADARALDRDSLSQRVTRAYGALLEATADRFPVRFWNFIPGILEPLGDLKHRYMAFNAGRINAYAEAWGGLAAVPERAPCASGLGIPGDHLHITSLASALPGTPIENPRQTASYRYSEVHGPLPPCFARATLLGKCPGQPSRLLVAGTASIRGQDTLHQEALQEQIQETFLNLASVVHAALSLENSHKILESVLPEMWGRYRQLRIYYPTKQDCEIIKYQVEKAFPQAGDKAYFETDLCRDHLRIEVEGWAEIL